MPIGRSASTLPLDQPLMQNAPESNEQKILKKTSRTEERRQRNELAERMKQYELLVGSRLTDEETRR
jgi:hypothetical protein